MRRRARAADPVLVEVLTGIGKAAGLGVTEADVARMLDPRSGDFFQTPPPLADELVRRADIRPGMTVLDPSGGAGRLVLAIRRAHGSAVHVAACEIHPGRRAVLAGLGCRIVGSDFLHFGGETFDRILMNPPFSDQADIAHVSHAFSLLRPGGILCAVVSRGAEFRQDKRAQAFRALIARHGSMQRLPDDVFKPEGTAIRTCLVTLTRGTGVPAARPVPLVVSRAPLAAPAAPSAVALPPVPRPAPRPAPAPVLAPAARSDRGRHPGRLPPPAGPPRPILAAALAPVGPLPGVEEEEPPTLRRPVLRPESDAAELDRILEAFAG